MKKARELLIPYGDYPVATASTQWVQGGACGRNLRSTARIKQESDGEWAFRLKLKYRGDCCYEQRSTQ